MKLSNLSKEEKRLIKGYSKRDSVPVESVIPSPDSNKLTFLCVRYGNRYGVDYVEKLRNMVKRNLTVPFRFVCLTDDPKPIDGVELIVQPSKGYRKLWWQKVHMFDPALPLNGRILYADLDVIIHNNIDKLITNCGNNFYGIRDFNRKFHPGWNRLNSSVMSWIHGSQSEIYQKFIKDIGNAMRLHGDQDWIWKIAKDRIKFWPDQWIQSYKWEIRNRSELADPAGKKGFKTINYNLKIPNDCSIAVFHGDPKPQTIMDTFVIDNWK